MRRGAALATALAFAAPAGASEPMELVGQASYRAGIFALYDAALFAPDGDFAWEAPFALTLTYRLSVEAERIAEIAAEEMARVTGLPEEEFTGLRERLAACFADVDSGDSLTGLSASADSATFFHNGEKRCDISHPGFRDAFFGIWLGETSRRPDLADELMGEGDPA